MPSFAPKGAFRRAGFDREEQTPNMKNRRARQLNNARNAVRLAAAAPVHQKNRYAPRRTRSHAALCPELVPNHRFAGQVHTQRTTVRYEPGDSYGLRAASCTRHVGTVLAKQAVVCNGPRREESL